jgi:ABC-type multidrug transport system ATPase subunit
VLDLIEEFGLKKATNTIIGNERARGVSGGERKRVNIGISKE